MNGKAALGGMACVLIAVLFLLPAGVTFAQEGKRIVDRIGNIEYEVTFSQSDLVFSKYQKDTVEYDIVELAGCAGSTQELGNPQLPAKEVTFVVPQAAKVKQVHVLDSTYEVVAGEFYIYPTQYPNPMEYPLPWIPPDPFVYESNTPYPHGLIEYVVDGYRSGFHLVSFRIYPLHYIPSERKLRLYTHISFQLELVSDSNGAIAVHRRSKVAQETLERTIKSMVANPEDVTSSIAGVTEIGRPGSPATGPYDYIIITSNTLKSEFQALADWRNKTGIVTKVVDFAEVETDPYGWGYLPGCADFLEKVRGYIKGACTHWGTQWVLIGGDVGIHSPEPFVRYVWAGSSNESVPSDLYLSGLNGNWDSNNNTKYGEVSGITLFSVHFVDINNGWAVGNKGGQGIIVHTTDGGESWEQQWVGTGAQVLRSVAFWDINQGCAVGHGGIALYTSNGGSTWSQSTTAISQALYGLSVLGVGKGWAVGANGTVLYTGDGGINWTAQTSNTTQCLASVCFVDNSYGWAVGANGTVISTQDGGQSWNKQAVGAVSWRDVCFVDKYYGWILCEQRVCRTTNGGVSWNWITLPTNTYAYGMSFVDRDNGWIVGSQGQILHTSTGGIPPWTEQEARDEFKKYLLEVDAITANDVWSVGDKGVVRITHDGGQSWVSSAAMPEDFPDFHPDVWLGRAPVETGTEVSAFVNKVVTYESPTAVPRDYARKMAFMGGSFSDANGTFAAHLEDLQKPSLHPWWPTDVDPYVTLYELYGPRGPGTGPEGSWHADKPLGDGMELTHDNAIDAINSGFNLIFHVDHSSPVDMGTGHETSGGKLTPTDINALTNEGKYSILVSGGCSINAFDYSADCIMEHFVLAPQKAGVAAIGSVKNGFRDAGFDTLLKSLFVNNLYNVGTAFSTMQDIARFGWEYHERTHLLGDPAMPVWTRLPQDLIVEHPTWLPATSFSVKVKDASGPVVGAKVCLWKPRDVIVDEGFDLYRIEHTNVVEHGWGVANFGGVYPQSLGSMYVTVTKQNYIPYQGLSYVVDPRAIKQSAVSELERVNPAKMGAQQLIDRSIRFINSSVSKQLWVDARRLNPKVGAGALVFFRELAAVLSLEAAKKIDPTVEDELEAVIDKLIKADESLATTAIGDAKGTKVMDPRKRKIVDGEIAKAEEELEKAYEYLEKNMAAKAMSHFELAWLDAQRAIKIAQWRGEMLPLMD